MDHSVVKARREAVLSHIRGGVFVSCQGVAGQGTFGVGNPFHTPERLLLMAEAAYKGGAVGFRANSPENISLMKRTYPEMVMIGIWKQFMIGNDVYITTNMDAVDKIAACGVEIVAVDATDRVNAFGKRAWEIIPEIKQKYPLIQVMADISTFDEARHAVELGADIVATTLSGHTSYTRHLSGGCNFDLVREISGELGCFVICEGKIWSREDAKRAFDCGAGAIVVGTAITNPMLITKRIVDYCKE